LAFIDENLVTFDSHLGGPDNSLPMLFTGLDTLELAEVSFLTAAADLAALQARPSYTLAHIQVEALPPRALPSDFGSAPFATATDYSGTPIDTVMYQGTSVTILAVEPPPPPPASDAPEPDSAFLLLTGTCLVVGARLGQRMGRPNLHLFPFGLK